MKCAKDPNTCGVVLLYAKGEEDLQNRHRYKFPNHESEFRESNGLPDEAVAKNKRGSLLSDTILVDFGNWNFGLVLTWSFFFFKLPVKCKYFGELRLSCKQY